MHFLRSTAAGEMAAAQQKFSRRAGMTEKARYYTIASGRARQVATADSLMGRLADDYFLTICAHARRHIHTAAPGRFQRERHFLRTPYDVAARLQSSALHH